MAGGMYIGNSVGGLGSYSLGGSGTLSAAYGGHRLQWHRQLHAVPAVRMRPSLWSWRKNAGSYGSYNLNGGLLSVRPTRESQAPEAQLQLRRRHAAA